MEQIFLKSSELSKSGNLQEEMKQVHDENGNQTIISEFLLLGMPIQPELKALFYAYLTTVLGNMLIILLIYVDSRLHTPMYLFLTNLSFSDMCFSSVTIPKLLVNMQSSKPIISYTNCLAQLYFFLLFADVESFLLVAMAYDRYVAICYPLHYTVMMSPKLCGSLLALSWVLTFSISLLHTLLVSQIVFCNSNIIPHFFCDMSALLKLACSDIHINELMIFIFGGLVIVIPFLLIIASYSRILFSILKVPSVRGIRKAFSTCSSHLSVVSLFYGTIIGLYLCPSANNSTVKETVMSIMYTVVTPMLNPFIYSLRNQDIKGAFKKLLEGRKFPFSLKL
ncbi:olfactory receptor 1E5-like [Sminthopsis crassicaudata]|uniref:olfactory receptor 1E5-like n=1 Tax=Sminthopsis crassicaudata TaxID=9301 RepID=UPI003D68CDE4